MKYSTIYKYQHNLYDNVYFECVAPDRNTENGMLTIWRNENYPDCYNFEFDCEEESIAFCSGNPAEIKEISEKALEILCLMLDK